MLLSFYDIIYYFPVCRSSSLYSETLLFYMTPLPIVILLRDWFSRCIPTKVLIQLKHFLSELSHM